MKNLLLGINIILILAVGYLFVDRFSGNTQAATSNGTTSVAASGANAGTIAYINVDTLYAGYEYYQDVKKQLEQKAKQASSDLEGRMTKFAKKRDDYVKMAQAGLLSKNEIEKREQQLMQEGQEVERYQASVQQGLAAFEQEKQQELFEQITSFLETYNKDKGYQYILGFQPGNVVWHAEKSQDITAEVVEALNKAAQGGSESAE